MSTKMKYTIYAIVILGLLVLLEYLTPKQVNWMKTFNVEHKIPYGLYVFSNSLERMFPESVIYRPDSSAYEVFKDEDYSSMLGANYIYVRDNFDLDRESFDEILDWTSRGNNAFISAHYLRNGFLSDSLKFKVKLEWNMIDDEKTFLGLMEFETKKADIRLTNPKYNENYDYPLAQTIHYASSIDTANAVVMGEILDDKINFVRYSIGEGYLYLHTSPLAFSNYNMIKNSDDYVFNVMSYLGDGDIILDQNGMTFESSSPLRFILSQESLRMAYLTAMFGLILYLIFSWKRKHRAIPVVLPPRNTTVAFIKTIANLYFQKGQHRNIFNKKVHYLLEFIRRNFRIKTERIDPEFFELLASRSAVDEDFLVQMFAEIRTCQSKYDLTLQDIIEINKKIDRFYKEADYDRQ
jgi:hypothetical protein